MPTDYRKWTKQSLITRIMTLEIDLERAKKDHEAERIAHELTNRILSKHKLEIAQANNKLARQEIAIKSYKDAVRNLSHVAYNLSENLDK